MLIANRFVPAVIGAAIDVHRALGPGLFESAYEESLAHEFGARGIVFRRQVAVPLRYKDVPLGRAYRIDFVVHEEIGVELKSVRVLLPLHDAQVLSYMRLLKLRHGLLFNFNARRLVDGLRSYVL